MNDFLENLASYDVQKARDLEAYVVNTLKLKMMVKYEQSLVRDGQANLRKLLLVPIFTIKEMAIRIENLAPEMKTVFFKELTKVLNSVEIGFKN